MCMQGIPWNKTTIIPYWFGKYANVWEILKYHASSVKVTHCKIIKLSFGCIHPQLINMDLQEDMVIKGI